LQRGAGSLRLRGAPTEKGSAYANAHMVYARYVVMNQNR